MNQALLDAPSSTPGSKGRTPSGRWGKPEDLVGVTVFLGLVLRRTNVNGQIIYSMAPACRDMIIADDRASPTISTPRRAPFAEMVAYRDPALLFG